MARKTTTKVAKEKKVEALTHEQARRKNIPTAEHQSLAQRQEEHAPVGPIRYSRVYPLKAGTERARDKDIDPQIIWNGARIRLSKDQIRQLQEKGEIEIGDAQLVWRGKDQQDWSDLVVNAPPLYIQEKVHPKAIIDDLTRQSKKAKADSGDMPDLFSDFNGLDDPQARTEFYQHSQHWSNRMILGDSLQVMASLAEREHLRGQVQCIYFDPPYGIKFNSNWQVSTLSRDVKDGKQTDISREPEQVKAFRDTWKNGIHSYLTYLRDRLTIARDLLHESGSIFVQIGDENVHRVRTVMDEVFGPDNFVSQIAFQKTGGFSQSAISNITDHILWFARSSQSLKFRPSYVYAPKPSDDDPYYVMLDDANGATQRVSPEERRALTEIDQLRLYRFGPLKSDGNSGKPSGFCYNGQVFTAGGNSHWKTHLEGMARLGRAGRILQTKTGIHHKLYWGNFPALRVDNIWFDTQSGGFGEQKVYVVQTTARVVQRCILMATDPGDLVLDPTCGSGTTAAVAEQWGRRWITIDTSRVALALARTRLMSARYPFYHLADSKEGRAKEQQASGKIQPDTPTYGDIRQGFVYERAPHITLKSIANNAEIDVIWEDFQKTLEPLRAGLNKDLGRIWEEWEIPREADAKWSETAKRLHAAWWDARIERQKKIDASIGKAADVEMLYDRPYDDKSRVRVAGPFTVESLSPHRVVPADEDMNADKMKATDGKRRRSKLMTSQTDFADMVIENLRTAGVHQAEKRDTIRFTSLTGWPGEYICAEAHFQEGETQRRAAIFLGPEFGTLSRVDLVAAAREATEARFDVLIACSFNFDAHAAELTRLGPLPILKAKMNPDLHMADELKNTGKGNLFVVFGEPDIDIEDQGDETIVVKVNGIDVFDPNTGQIRSNDVKGIAAWFIDTDYNEESFFVRHAYFLGANDPYKSLKTALRAEINPEAWETLYRDSSRPFPRPSTGRIAVKVINHFGDEVMKVYQV